EQAVARFEGTLLQILVSSVDGVPGLEGDDAPPALLTEKRSGLGGIETMLRELDDARPAERGHLAAEIDVALIVDGFHAGVRVLDRPVDLGGFALLVGPVFLREVKNRQWLPAFL